MIGCFSGRVDDYVKTRPSYPRGVLDVLARTCGLTRDAGAVVADLGSGTGIFSRLLLDPIAGAREVLGVEPNEEMRAAAEAMLAEAGTHEKFDALFGGVNRWQRELRALFDRHANGARDLAMLYTTVVITGRVA